MLTDYQIYGEKVFRLKPDKKSRRALEIHGLQGFWQTDSENYFGIGNAPPDYPNMRIVEIESDTEIETVAYEQRIQCEGILGNESFLMLSKSETTPEEGWDEIPVTIYTRFPDDARWARGSRLRLDDVGDVAGTAADDKLSKAEHGLVTGQLCAISFTSGFTGLTSGNEYFVIRINANQIKVALTKADALAGTAIDITDDGDDATITPFPVGYEFMFIMERAKHMHRAKDYFTLDLSLKGLIGDKPAKRRTTTSGQAVSTKYPGPILLIGTNYTGYPPEDAGTTSSLSATDADIEYDLPAVTISDVIVTTTAPPLSFIGQFWTPPNVPTLSSGFTPLGGAYSYHVPFNWKCTQLQSEQLGDKSVYLVNVSWTKQRAMTPAQPAAS